MSDLPEARILKSPLVVLALSLAIGIFVFHYFDPKTAIAFLVFALVPLWIAAALVLRTQSSIAIALLLVAFIATGYLLALVERGSVSPTRIVRMFERGMLGPEQP